MNARSNKESTQHAEGEAQDVSLQDGRLEMLGEEENERQLRLALYVAYRMMGNISGSSEKLMWSEGDQRPMPHWTCLGVLNETEKGRPVPHWACQGTETIRGEKKIDEAGFVFRMFFDSRGPDFSDERDTINFATLVQSIVLLARPLPKNPLALKPKG